MADAVIDNDVILKGVSYGFLDGLLAALPGGPFVYGALGTARFVLPKALKKRPPQRAEAAMAELMDALASLETLEPSEHETVLAAELEYEAQRQSKPMHPGECQLVAILVTRALHHVLTGDRNAIAALGTMLLPATLDPSRLVARFICFEQAIRHLMDAQGPAPVKASVCAERNVDTAMRVCFSCASPEVGEASWIEGLENHIAALRAESGDLLIA
jgi:hypothetical protein